MCNLIYILFFMYFALIFVFGLMFCILIGKVKDLIASNEYYKSVCEQSVAICKKSEESVKEIKKSFTKAKTKAFFQGINYKDK